jgi:uncharacterized cysteine cluster protein YcgN (CxxCxxCC family)
MSNPEWEAKCKRCGLCCRFRYKTCDGLLVYSTEKCRYLAADNTCTVYERRIEVAPWCRKLTPENLDEVGVPANCGYRS